LPIWPRRGVRELQRSRRACAGVPADRRRRRQGERLADQRREGGRAPLSDDHGRARRCDAPRAEGRIPALRDRPRLFPFPPRRRRDRGRDGDGRARIRSRPERRGALVLTVRLAALGAALAVVPGIVPADEPVSAPGAQLDGGTPSASIWDGVYTAAQAERGGYLYPGPCGKCHGRRLDGAPDDPDMFPTKPIAGPKFLRAWDGRSLAVLFEYLRATMPENNPGFLSDGEYADLIAYMLQRSGAPAGSSELPADPNVLVPLQLRATPEGR